MNDLLDTLASLRDRIVCKLTGGPSSDKGRHGPGCRGRIDHSPQVGRWWT